MAKCAAIATFVLVFAASAYAKCGDPHWACCGALGSPGKCNKGLNCFGRTANKAGGCFRPGCGHRGQKCCTNRTVKGACASGLTCRGSSGCVSPPTPAPPTGPPTGPPTFPGPPVGGFPIPGLIATAGSTGIAGSVTTGGGSSTSTGSGGTFTTKFPGVAVGTSTVGTQAVGNGQIAGNVGTGTFADVRAPGLLNSAAGQSSAGFGASGPGSFGAATSTDTSVATLGRATNSINTAATAGGVNGAGTAVNYGSFAIDP